MKIRNQLSTTPEQSRKMIKAGIDPNTADMHWLCRCAKDEDGNYHDVLFNGYLPECTLAAWSLAAIWRLAKEKGLNLVFSTGDDTPEDIVSLIVKALTDNDTEKD